MTITSDVPATVDQPLLAPATESAAPAVRSLLPLAAAAVTVLLWSSAFVAIRQAGHDFSAGALSLGRLLVAAAVLAVPVLRRRRTWPSRSEWVLLAMVGVCWLGVYNVALNEAEHHLDAGIAAMLVNVGPIIIAVLAGIVLHEGFPRGLLIGSPLAFAGVVIIALSGTNAARADVSGIVLCLLAAATYAVGVVAQKPLLRRLQAITVTWLAIIIALVVCLPFAPALAHDLSHAAPSSILLMVYLGAFPTAIAFTTWAFALSRTTAGKMGATTYVVPALAILMGWALLGEQPTLLTLAGGVVALAGVYITRRVR